MIFIRFIYCIHILSFEELKSDILYSIFNMSVG